MHFITDTNRNDPHKYQQKGFKKVQEIYEDVYDEKSKRLVTKHTDNNLFYDEIQEAKDSTYLPSILERYKIDINKKALVEIDSNVVDMTEMPQDMTSMYILMRNQELKFNKLPAEVKKQFDNNYLTFLSEARTGEAQNKINQYNKEIKTKKGLNVEKNDESKKEIIKDGQPSNIQSSTN